METKPKNNPKLPVYSLEIGDDDSSEVNFISLVKTPAIELDFVAFGKEDYRKKFKFKVHDAEKQQLAGVLMIPNTPIFRRDPDTKEEFYVTMSVETIENAQKKFMKHGYNNNINQDHDTKLPGCYLLENWKIMDPKRDKSLCFGFTNLQKDYWFGIIQVEDQSIWQNYIKTGELEGFSVEGMFIKGAQVSEKSKFSNQKPFEISEKQLEKLAEIIEKLT